MNDQERIAREVLFNQPPKWPRPPWDEPPTDSQRFQKIGNLLLPADGTTNTIVTFNVPIGYDGILRSIVNEFAGTGFVEGSGDLTWRIQQGQRFVADYDAITDTLGNLTTPFAITGDGIRLVSGQTLSYLCVIGAGANARLNPAGRIICAFMGLFWPRASGRGW